jgi:hypothetical protein
VSSPQRPPDKPLTPRQAWQPFTPRGIAAFAQATLTRLVLAQMAVAAMVALAVVWFLSVAWFPIITESIQALPSEGEIRDATLHLSSESPARLAENARLAFVIDPFGTGKAGRVADVEVIFGKARVAICGALGCCGQPYDRGYVISFNRPALAPAWGAWRGPSLGLAALASMVSMLLMWWTVAILYIPLVKFIALYTDRIVTWWGAWRLSSAALMPGALIVALALVLYGFGVVDLLRLVLFFALHVAAGLLFVMTSSLFLPRISEQKRRKNPFNEPKTK